MVLGVGWDGMKYQFTASWADLIKFPRAPTMLYLEQLALSGCTEMYSKHVGSVSSYSFQHAHFHLSLMNISAAYSEGC